MARREYTAGRATTLDGAFNIGASTFTIADDGSSTSWPTSTDYDFFVTIDAGTAQEERVLCSARSGRVITVAASGRGKDSTGEKNHASGATVWPSWSAQDADEANVHIESTGYASYSKSVHGLGSGDGVVVGTDKSQTLTAKTLASPTITGTITGAVVTSANIVDGTIVNADIASGAAISATKLTGTTAEFNGALSDNDFATLAGTETLTNKTLTTPTINGDASFNTEIGTSALNALTTGTSNTALGYNALLLNTTGSSNTAVGSTALDANTTGSSNTAIGNSTLGANTSGTGNTAVGRLSLVTNTSGSNLTAVGFNALRLNTSGSSGVAVGNNALYSNTTGNSNVAVGDGALYSNLNGYDNIAIGREALQTLTANPFNIAIGVGSLGTATGEKNTAVGVYSGQYITTGYFNTLVGGDVALGLTTGNNNTVVGTQAASTLTTGSNNIVLGTNAATSTATVSNQVVLGNSSITDLRCQDTTISAPSDIRDKTDVQDIPVGLDFINNIRPVNFEWNMRDGGQVGNRQGGFIAQEVLAVEQQYNTRNWLGMVNDDNPDQLVLAPAKLIPVLVKAIQELSDRVAELESH